MAKWNLDKIDNGADEGHATVTWHGRSYSIEVERVQIDPDKKCNILGKVKIVRNFNE